MTNKTGSLCLVTPELPHAGEDGDLGTRTWRLAAFLAEQGWHIHLLHTGKSLDEAQRTLLCERGIAYTHLDEVAIAAIHEHPYWFTDFDARSQRVWKVLEELHRAQRFDLIEFPERGCLGFRTLQARRAGLGLDDVGVIVRLHGCSRWRRDEGYQWMKDANDLIQDHCERFAFENADYQSASSNYLREQTRRLGWKVSETTAVVPEVLPLRTNWATRTASAWPPEIVFWGALDPNQGLRAFFRAVQTLDPEWPLTFLGADVDLGSGLTGSALVQQRLPGRRLNFLTNLRSEEAWTYVRQNAALVVFPRTSPAGAQRVADCAAEGIPFLASRTGEITEIITDPDLQNHILFEPDYKDLRRCLTAWFQIYQAEREQLRQDLRDHLAVESNHDEVLSFYRGCLTDAATRFAGQGAFRLAEQEQPLVTVAVPYHNLGAFLPETLASIGQQTYRNLEVFVVDDGSTEPESLRIFEEQKQLYPRFHFIQHANMGVCATRNRMLAEARGEFFFPLDADNVMMPRMLERLATALVRNPECSAMGCFRMDFRSSEDLIRGNYSECYRPLGGPGIFACFQNVFGETSGLFRTEALRSIGGYEDLHPEYVSEDWHIYVKLAAHGHIMGMVPEHLYYYRLRGDSRYHNGNLYITHQQILQFYINRTRHLTDEEQVALWNTTVSLYHSLNRRNVECGGLYGQLAESRGQTTAAWTRVHQVEEELRRVQAELLIAQDQVVALASYADSLLRKMGQLRYRLVDGVHGFIRRVPFSGSLRRAIPHSRNGQAHAPVPEQQRLAG